MRQKKLTTRNALLTVLSVVLALCFAFGIAFAIPIKAKAEDGLVEVPEGTSQWDGDLEKAGWGSESTDVPEALKDTYIVDDNLTPKTITIRSADAFAFFARQSNIPENKGFEGYTVKLDCDIDLNNEIWIPIGFAVRKKGNVGNAFRGTFDGQNNTIYNFSFEKLYDSLVYNDGYFVKYSESLSIPFLNDGGEYNYGLISATGNATVQNLNVVNVNLDTPSKFTCNETDYTLIADGLGTIVGYGAGSLTVKNCSVGSLNGNDIINNRTDDNVAVGGLVGRIYGGLSNGEPYGDNAGDVSNNNNPTGQYYLSDKYFSYGNTYFENCINYIDIITVKDGNKSPKVGGICGYSYLDLERRYVNCVNYGNIVSGYHVGGVTSYIQIASSNGIKDEDGNITSADFVFDFTGCKNYGNISGVTFSGGLVGRSSTHFGNSYTDNNKKTYTLSVTDCLNYGDISNSLIKGTTDSNAITGVGGLFGYLTVRAGADGKITNSFNYGKIDLGAELPNDFKNKAGVGGLVGWMQLTAKTSGVVSMAISGGNCGELVVPEGAESSGCIGKFDQGYSDTNYTKGYLINAYSGTEVTIGNDNEAEDFTQYLDIQDNVIKGLTEEGKAKVAEEDLKAYSITVPAYVKEVDFAAFIGEAKLAQVAFAQNGNLTEIGDWAFAGTGITSLELPEGLKTMGAAAFGGCGGLNNVLLPEDAATVKIGSNAFNGTRLLNGKTEGAFLIASNSEQYELLVASENYAEYQDELTYIVTIKYDYRGTLVGEEKRLYGMPYNLVLGNDGIWKTEDNPSLGPVEMLNTVWNTQADGKGEQVAQENEFSAVLGKENYPEDVITLYAFDSDVKIFIARDDIVYDGSEYATDELNSLLFVSSSYILPEMEVSIIGYTDANGNEVAALPEKVCNAGEYTIEVKDGDNTHTFTINIARAKVDLSDTKNLEWNLTEVDGKKVANTQLNSYTLYMYTDNEGNDYPSTQILTAEQVANLKLSSSAYTTREVQYSVVRNRGDVSLTIEIIGSGYEIIYENKTGKGIGGYTAIATLKADDNHEFILGPVSSLRGMKIELAEDCLNATVTKTWYIVDQSNWLVTSSGEDYSIKGHIYQDDVNYGAPLSHYLNKGGNNGGEITMHLYLDGTLIGNDAGFGYDAFNNYVNKYMPAGRYTLVVDVAGGFSRELDEENTTDEENPVYMDVYHNGFRQTITFTVDKRELPSLKDTIDAALKGNKFTYLQKDGESHLYDSSVQITVNKYLASSANQDRKGTIWAEPYYADYYSEFVLEYNLYRMKSDNYSSTVKTDETGEYTVYYKVSAKNYYSSIDNLNEGEVRQDYYFTVINVFVVDVINADDISKVYNGEAQTADVTDGIYYTVKENNGGTNAGTYKVVLELTQPEYYMWAGQELADRKAETTIDFVIAQAENSWLIERSIVSWSFESFDASKNLVFGQTRYLDEGKSIYFFIATDEKGENKVEGLEKFYAPNGIVNDTAVIAKLNGLPADTYYLFATPEESETNNYKAETSQGVSFIVNTAPNSWSSFTVIGWEYGKYNKDTNLFLAVAEHGTVNFTVKQGGKVIAENFSTVSDELALTLNSLEKGSYTVIASVAVNSANYAELPDTETTFEVIAASNEWIVTPNVIAWQYGDFDINTNLIEAKVTNGDIYVTVLGASGAAIVEEFKLGADRKFPASAEKVLNGLGKGTYKISVRVVTSDDNYGNADNIQPVSFDIAALNNDWIVSPGIVYWHYNNFVADVNIINAEPKQGTVVFKITNNDGTQVISKVSGHPDGTFTLDKDGLIPEDLRGVLNGLPATTYKLIASVTGNDNYSDIGETVAVISVMQAKNNWISSPSIEAWIQGKYDAESNLISAEAQFGKVNYVIYEYDNPENVIYDSLKGIDNLAAAKAGSYILEGSVSETNDYAGINVFTFTFKVFEKPGLPWWAVLLIVVGSLGLAAIILWILHEKGVLQMLTGKVVIAMRTKMTVDATIAAVRANMVAENSKKTRAQAEAKDRAEALIKAREEAKNRPADEQAAALAEKADEAARKAEKMQKRAESMQKRAEKMKKKAEKEAAAEQEQTITADEPLEEISGETNSADSNTAETLRAVENSTEAAPAEENSAAEPPAAETTAEANSADDNSTDGNPTDEQ